MAFPAQRTGIVDNLPIDLRRELQSARSRIAGRIGLVERYLAPACQRYAGSLYQVAGGTLLQAVWEGLHVLIVSGGYGLLLASEPIGLYNARFHLTDWPKGLLEDCLLAYAEKHRLTSMRGFMASTTDYGKLLRRVSWSCAGVLDARLISPEATTGAMVKAPRAQGEALVATLSGSLTDDWQSSDGLRIVSEPLG